MVETAHDSPICQDRQLLFDELDEVGSVKLRGLATDETEDWPQMGSSEKTAQNRPGWRRVVDGLCSTWSYGPK